MSLVFGYEHNQKILILKCKKSKFLVYGKMLFLQFPYMKKNTIHRPFMLFFVRMDMYGKCMTSNVPYMEIV